MKTELRKEALRLRLEQEMSYSQIKKKLGVSKSTLSHWLRGFPLSEKRILKLQKNGKTKAAAKYEKYRNTMSRIREQEDLKIYNAYKKRFESVGDKEFFVAGIMLYLAEGQKRRRSVKLANTDPDILLFFMNWALKFFDVDKSRFRAQLHLYKNMDLEKETEFWQNTLGLSKEQLWKTQVRKLKPSSFTYSGLHRHGTCSLYVGGVKEWRIIMMSSKAFLEYFNK